MSVFRTAYPDDSFTAYTPDGPVVIGYNGTAVLDAYDQSIRAQAAASGVVLLEGGIVVPPSSSPLQTQVSVLAGQVSQMPVPLVEQATRVVGPAWGLARSGQTVPVSMDGATGNRTLQLETGGTGSRLAVRLDVASADGWALGLTGTGDDVVPAVQLATAGSLVVLEGIVGGGGWRVVNLYAGNSVAWSQITGKPTIPTQLSELDGAVNDGQIPDHITRDTELSTGLAGKSDTGHTHAAQAHTHDNAVCEARLTADITAIPNSSYFGLRASMAPPSGMDAWGMWGGGGANLYTMTVPAGWAGRWRVTWSAFTNSAATTRMLAILFLDAPPSTPDNNTLGPYTCARSTAMAGDPVSVSQSFVLDVGETISMGLYSYASGGTFNLYALLPGSYYARSKVVMEWTGPR